MPPAPCLEALASHDRRPCMSASAGAGPAPSLDTEHARGVAVEPLVLDGVLERQRHVLVDQRLDRLADEAAREPDEHLVLDERVAELHQHLPAGASLAEILRAVGGGVHVELGMAAP